MEVDALLSLQSSDSENAKHTARSADTSYRGAPLRRYFAEGIPLYLAATEWFQGKVAANTLKTRDFTRTLIESNTPEGMVLTVPVVGGASAVKRLKPTQLEISGHGDWTRIHLGAIEAAYGREPYFQHLFPEIATIISDYPQHLTHLNVLLMEKMMEFIGFSGQIGSIEAMRESHPERCAAIKQRLESKIDPRHSLLEPLFRLGPDALFLLMESRLSSLRPEEISSPS
ncbi:MAG: WbqC family protein [Muribaculaceae bacterium]|nr:WbqC family protein [Muribaculaceae bacterium]